MIGLFAMGNLLCRFNIGPGVEVSQAARASGAEEGTDGQPQPRGREGPRSSWHEAWQSRASHLAVSSSERPIMYPGFCRHEWRVLIRIHAD